MPNPPFACLRGALSQTRARNKMYSVVPNLLSATTAFFCGMTWRGKDAYRERYAHFQFKNAVPTSGRPLWLCDHQQQKEEPPVRKSLGSRNRTKCHLNAKGRANPACFPYGHSFEGRQEVNRGVLLKQRTTSNSGMTCMCSI